MHWLESWKANKLGGLVNWVTILTILPREKLRHRQPAGILEFWTAFSFQQQTSSLCHKHIVKTDLSHLMQALGLQYISICCFYERQKIHKYSTLTCQCLVHGQKGRAFYLVLRGTFLWSELQLQASDTLSRYLYFSKISIGACMPKKTRLSSIIFCSKGEMKNVTQVVHADAIA